MKSNTTSTDNRYTIQPLTTCIDIKTERKLIASWHTSGLSDVQIRKMLMLYFGEPAWMNLQKLYDCNRFSQIATGLRFRSRQEFVELLLRCAGFGFIWKNKEKPHTGKNLLAFYTPIWHVSDEKDMVNEQDSDENLQDNLGYINNNIYIIKKNNKKKNISKYVSPSQLANSPEHEKKVEAAAKELIHFIGTDPDAYAKVVKPVNEITQKANPDLFTNPGDACPSNMATNIFFNNYLYPYLLTHSERMMKIQNILGRSCWLANLINIDFMQKNIMRAVNDATKYLKLHAAEMMRQYRPISNFEYQDKVSKQRFYDTTRCDGTPEQHRIPPDAAPRPSGNAAWNKFSHTWVSPK
jgi:hypothetical protein